MVDPKVMCRNQLLGEHAEIHTFVWNIDRKHSVKGCIGKGLLEAHNLYIRHEELVHELRRRGYQHDSELDEKWKLAKKAGSIDKKRNLNSSLTDAQNAEKDIGTFSEVEVAAESTPKRRCHPQHPSFLFMGFLVAFVELRT